MKISKRISDMQFSPIRKLTPFAQAAKDSGKKVYHLNIGQPDIETPKEFFDAVKNFDESVLAYSSSHGHPALLESFSHYYKSYNIDFTTDDMLITNGGSEALNFALTCVCDDGDEVLVPEPFYTNYNGFGAAVGVSVVPITTKAENGFKLPKKSFFEEKINSRTKAILLSNPGNPTGAVYTNDEIFMLCDIAKQHDLYIISDEVYREFVYDGLEYLSFAQIPEIEDRVIIIDSISKRYSACGARIGCLASKNKEFMAQAMKLCQGRLCVPIIEQIGAAALANVSKGYMQAAFTEYQKRRDIVYTALCSMDGVVCKKPQGAFYIIAKLPIKNAENFAKWMLTDFSLDNATVMMAPAEGFYATKGLGRDEVRLSYVLKQEELEACMKIFAKGLAAYREIEK